MKKLLLTFLIAVLLTASAAQAQEAAPAAPVSPPTAAPAAAAPPAREALPSWLEYKPAYLGEENNIINPHRTAEEITTWAQQAAAEVLTFSQADYLERMSSFKKYFVQQGWQMYTTYLKDTKAIDMVGTGGYSIGAIVNQAPEVVNQGASGGAYHWILRMPITISFFKKDAAGTTQTGPTGQFYLFLDVLRVAQGGGDDGIAIANWRIMNVPRN